MWLRRNGRYRWFEWHGDYGDQSTGRWNFEWSPKGHGVVLLAHQRVKKGESHSAMAFTFQGDKLFYHMYSLAPGKKIRYGDKQAALQSDSLPELSPPELFEQLTANTWKKANPFDKAYAPDLVRFDHDGRFFASYRDGKCCHGGFWSVAGTQLTGISDSNPCDLRGGTSASIGAHKPLIRDDFMMLHEFGNPYYPADRETEIRTFAFDRWGTSMMLIGRYQGEIQHGKPLKLSLAFENRDQHRETQHLKSLRIESRNFKIDKDSMDAAGPMHVLYDKRFDDVAVEPGKSHLLDATISIPEVGKSIGLAFSLDYQTRRRPYHAYQLYFTEVKP